MENVIITELAGFTISAASDVKSRAPSASVVRKWFTLGDKNDGAQPRIVEALADFDRRRSELDGALERGLRPVDDALCHDRHAVLRDELAGFGRRCLCRRRR